MRRLKSRAVYPILAAVVVATVAFAGGVLAGHDWAGGAAARSEVRARTAPADTAGVRQHVFVYGDSLVTQSAPYLQAVAGSLGLDVTTRAFAGTAPCDFVTTLRDDIAHKRPDLVLWAFSGNSIGTCMLGEDGLPLTGPAVLVKYRADTEAAIDAADGARVPFVLASPPAPRNKGDVWEQLDTLYRYLAAAHPQIQYNDAGAAIAPDGQFLATQKCLPFEVNIPQAHDACGNAGGMIAVRGPDGAHFCDPGANAAPCTTYSSGALRYAINLLGAARLDLDFEAQVNAGQAFSRVNGQ